MRPTKLNSAAPERAEDQRLALLERESRRVPDDAAMRDERTVTRPGAGFVPKQHGALRGSDVATPRRGRL